MIQKDTVAKREQQKYDRQQYWQQSQQRHAMTQPQLHLNRIAGEPAVFIVSVPINDAAGQGGELLMHLDLAFILKSVARAQIGSDVHLIDNQGNTLLSVVDATQVVPDALDELSSKENIQTIRDFPVSLLVEAQPALSIGSVILSFFLHFAFYLIVLTILWHYSRRRFKNKVLNPFKRLLVHIQRLQRGDPQGVRHVPSEWVGVFHQIEQLKQSSAKKDDS